MNALASHDDQAFHSFLAAQGERSLLRFITCGSVDDGKSTLIGRLLYESKLLFDDQLAALEADSRRMGTQAGDLDFALLVDGLSAEREQGITIDVAYRFFATDRRRFIVADTPGHEQYTRNMATGASTADLAIVLIDARKGILTQTRRHSIIAAMLGVRHVILAVNKMDLVNYSEFTFAKIERDFRAFAGPLGFADISCVPLSALKGDNVVAASAHMPWYHGQTLMAKLETVPLGTDSDAGPFRLPVQWVNRPNADFRGYCGLVSGGRIWRGDRVRILPSGKESRVRRIVTADGDLDHAGHGQSITLVLDDEIDISRGDVITAAAEPASVGSALEARILWMSERALKPGQPYLLKVGTKTVAATLDAPAYVLDINSLDRGSGSTLRLNETGACHLRLDRPVTLDPYAVNRETGGFILIDRLGNETVAMGFVERVLEVTDTDSISGKSGNIERIRRIAFFGRSVSIKPRLPRARERLWRSVGKAISWRFVGLLDTLILAYLFTGNAKITLAIGFAEIVTKTGLYVVHERVWARIGLGVRDHQAPSPQRSPGSSSS